MHRDVEKMSTTGAYSKPTQSLHYEDGDYQDPKDL